MLQQLQNFPLNYYSKSTLSSTRAHKFFIISSLYHFIGEEPGPINISIIKRNHKELSEHQQIQNYFDNNQQRQSIQEQQQAKQHSHGQPARVEYSEQQQTEHKQFNLFEALRENHLEQEQSSDPPNSVNEEYVQGPIVFEELHKQILEQQNHKQNSLHNSPKQEEQESNQVVVQNQVEFQAQLLQRIPVVSPPQPSQFKIQELAKSKNIQQIKIQQIKPIEQAKIIDEVILKESQPIINIESKQQKKKISFRKAKKQHTEDLIKIDFKQQIAGNLQNPTKDQLILPETQKKIKKSFAKAFIKKQSKQKEQRKQEILQSSPFIEINKSPLPESPTKVSFKKLIKSISK